MKLSVLTSIIRIIKQDKILKYFLREASAYTYRYSAITEKANEALIFRRRFSPWITTFASLSAPQETQLGSVPVSKRASPYKKQGRNVELQLTSASRGRVRHPLAATGVTMLSQNRNICFRFRLRLWPSLYSRDS